MKGQPRKRRSSSTVLIMLLSAVTLIWVLYGLAMVNSVIPRRRYSGYRRLRRSKR